MSIAIKHNLVKSVAIVTFFSVTTRFLSFIYKILISRYFGAEAVGIFQMSLSFLMFFVSLTCSGLPLILSRKIAEMQGKNKIDEYKKVTFCLLFSLAICSLIAVVLIFSKNLLSMYFQNSKAVSVFYILLPALFTTTFYSIIRAWFLGNKQFLTFSGTELLEEVSKILLTFLFTMTVSSIGKEKIIALVVTASDFLCVIVLLILYFVKGGKLVSPNNNFNLIKNSAPITTSRIISSLIGAFSAFIIPFKLMEYGASTSFATATYGRFTGMCMPLINAPSALIGSLAVVLIPEIASLKLQKNNDIQQKIEYSMTFTILTAGLFVAIYLPLGKEICELVFNDGISGKYVSACSAIIFPLAINQLTTSLLNTLNKEKNTLINFVLGSVPMIFILIFVPKSLGILALGLGIFVAFTVTALLNLYTLNKIYKLSFKCYKSIFLCIIYSLSTGYLLSLINKSLDLSNLLNLIICCIVGVTVYFLLSFFSGLTPVKFLKLKLFKKKCNKIC